MDYGVLFQVLPHSGQCTLSWDSESDVSYQVVTCDDLRTGDWGDWLLEVPGTGSRLVVTGALFGASGFYRVFEK